MENDAWWRVASMDYETEREIELATELKYHSYPSLVDAHLFIPHNAEAVPVRTPIKIPVVDWVIRQIRKVFK